MEFCDTHLGVKSLTNKKSYLMFLLKGDILALF